MLVLPLGGLYSNEPLSACLKGGVLNGVTATDAFNSFRTRKVGADVAGSATLDAK
jgi:hypothetical protein